MCDLRCFPCLKGFELSPERFGVSRIPQEGIWLGIQGVCGFGFKGKRVQSIQCVFWLGVYGLQGLGLWF